MIMFFCHSWNLVEEVESMYWTPFPPRISFHPWSLVFRSRWLRDRGQAIVNWEDSGVRNHMEVVVFVVIWLSIELGGQVVVFVVISHDR